MQKKNNNQNPRRLGASGGGPNRNQYEENNKSKTSDITWRWQVGVTENNRFEPTKRQQGSGEPMGEEPKMTCALKKKKKI